MGKESDVEKSLPTEQEKASPSLWQRVVELIILIVTSVVLLVVFITNGLANVPNVGFANNTGDISDRFYLQVTPAGWTFSIWGVIYFWQVLWILYTWSFVFRPSTPRTVSWITLLLYTCGNLCNIIWIYVWGNTYPQVAFPFIFLIWAFLVAAIAIETVQLDRVTPVMQTQMKYKIDLWITRLLVTNGMVIYVTWLTAATHINFGIVLQYFANVSPITTGAVVAWLLSVIILGYFALENTILDRFTRFIFMVYPTLIWALSGVMSAHWGQEDPDTAPVLTLLLLLLVIILFIARVILVILFAFFRPLPHCAAKCACTKDKYSKEKESEENTV